jgi:hypothetical protein
MYVSCGAPHAFQLYLRLRCYGRCNRSRRVTDGHLQMIYLIYSCQTNQIIVNQQSTLPSLLNVTMSAILYYSKRDYEYVWDKDALVECGQVGDTAINLMRTQMYYWSAVTKVKRQETLLA